jgi:excisionase family DNA binding protein
VPPADGISTVDGVIALHLEDVPTVDDLAEAAELWQAEERARDASGNRHRLLTVPQVRGLLGCGKNLVYELIESGRLPALNVAARPGSRPLYRVRVADLEALRYSPPITPTESPAPARRRVAASSSRLRIVERELRASA